MTDAAKIIIEFQTYWIAGGGKAGGGLDAVTECDDCGCPVMQMSQIKGTLRETARRLWAPGVVDALFGNDEGLLSSSSPLAFRGRASLQDHVRAWFRENTEARQQLFRQVAATKIDEMGVAHDRTLRRIQVAVPLTIEGRVEWRGPANPPADWVESLDEVCAATLAFGKGKADGFGRAIAVCIGSDGRSA